MNITNSPTKPSLIVASRELNNLIMNITEHFPLNTCFERNITCKEESRKPHFRRNKNLENRLSTTLCVAALRFIMGRRILHSAVRNNFWK